MKKELVDVQTGLEKKIQQMNKEIAIYKDEISLLNNELGDVKVT